MATQRPRAPLSSLERNRASGRDKAHFGQLEPVKEGILWCAASLREPFPNTSCLLPAVTARASWNDVGRLGQTAFRHRYHVIPRGRWLGAVRAGIIEHLEQHFCRLDWNALDAPSTNGPPSAPCPVVLVCGISRAVGQRVAGATGASRQLIGWHPGLASSTPTLALGAARSALSNRWSGRHSGCGTTLRADVAPPIETALVDVEVAERPHQFTSAAPLLAVRASSDKPAVRRSSVLGCRHAVGRSVGFLAANLNSRSAKRKSRQARHLIQQVRA